MAVRRLRLPLALLLAVVVAEVAVVALLPREGVLEPAPVEATAYFSPAAIERANEYRGPQRWLSWVVLAAELALLAAVVRRPPAALRRAARRPLVAAAAVGALLSVGVDLAQLPPGAVLRARAIDVGLVTQGWGGWAWDLVRSAAIGAFLAGLGAAAAVALLRRAPRTWWLWASGVVVAFGFATVYLWPIVLDPVFNDFRRLPPGPLRADVMQLADRAGVDVGEVYVVDASVRTTAANAYVAGLGATKRVVLYDTLVEEFPPEEVRLVVAHELGHVHYDDLLHGLLWLALVAPAGMFAARALTLRLQPEAAARRDHRVVPALALSVALLVPTVTWISNQLSRAVEARADTYSLQLTGEPADFVAFERRIALRNVSDIDPPAWAEFLWRSHPPTLERIGIGEAWALGRRP